MMRGLLLACGLALAAPVSAQQIYGAPLKAANNLSDVSSPSQSRTNLGLGTLATQSAVTGSQITTGLGYTPASLGAGGNTFLGAQTINLNTDGVTPTLGSVLVINLADGGISALGVASFGAAGAINFNRQDGTASAPTAVSANEISGSLMFNFWDGSAFAGCGLSGVSIDAFTLTDHASGVRLFCPGRNQTTTRSAGVWDQDGLGLGPNTFSGGNPPHAPLDVETSATTLTTSDTATLGSASATGTITTSTIPSTWPTSGIMQVDNELIAYTELSTTSLSITARGQYGSTGAIHSCGASCTFDVAMVLVRSGTGLPTLIAMSNGTVGVGVLPPVPTAAAGTENAAARQAAGTAGVSCTGTPTSSFASVGGLVTHC